MNGCKAASLCALGLLSVAARAPDVVIDLTDTSLSQQSILATQVCAGLYNRDTSSQATTVYLMVSEPYSSEWLLDIEGVENPPVTAAQDFIGSCLARKSSVGGYILYDYATQQQLLPNLITLAAVLDAVPLEAGDPALSADAALLFDATAEWAGLTPLQATEDVYAKYVSNTTTLAFINPGYDNAANPSDPPLTGTPRLKLVDYLVKERVFTIYLNDACVPNTEEHAFMSTLVSSNPWPVPIPVYGYNDAYPIAGDIFEAETGCTPEHNMGQIASVDAFNLAYFSRTPALTVPSKQNEERAETYNSSKTYVNFVMGDGDNFAFLQTSRRDWMKKRVDNCAADPTYRGCFPLSWSFSPHARHLFPELQDWFYEQSYMTGHDYFMLPPSGDLYSYPGEMPADVQASFVENTENDALQLSTHGTVEWEWFAHWKVAEENYFPRYAEKKIVQGIFTVNVSRTTQPLSAQFSVIFA